jgi:prepilin signal peptidase PulO-like enzyme (type II secretory pathway)
VTAAVDVGVAAVLVALAAIDLRRRIVPNRIVLPAAVAVLALRTVERPSPVWLLAGLGAAGFLLLAAVVTRGGMGMGDVKLGLLVGFATGPACVLALAAAFLAAFAPSLVLLVRGLRRRRRAAIPFAPFLGFGCLVGLAALGI